MVWNKAIDKVFTLGKQLLQPFLGEIGKVKQPLGLKYLWFRFNINYTILLLWPEVLTISRKIQKRNQQCYIIVIFLLKKLKNYCSRILQSRFSTKKTCGISVWSREVDFNGEYAGIIGLYSKGILMEYFISDIHIYWGKGHSLTQQQRRLCQWWDLSHCEITPRISRKWRWNM